MKLESLNGKKFEVLSDEAMAHIVGGRNIASGAGNYGGLNCSNDYVDEQNVHHYMSGEGNDISHKLMQRACGEVYFVVPEPGDELYPEYIALSTWDPAGGPIEG